MGLEVCGGTRNGSVVLLTLSVLCRAFWTVGYGLEENGDCLGRDDIEGVDVVYDVAVGLPLCDFEDGGGIVVEGILPDLIC